MVQRSVLVVAALVLAAFVGSDATACEPIHTLINTGESAVPCQPGELVCDQDPSGDPINCRECNPADPDTDGLCWASDCRSFGGGDSGQFGQFKKDAKGELEALVMVITNETTGESITIVDQVSNPDCAIPASDPDVACNGLYKIARIRPDGAPRGSPLCTFNNLDDLNTVARTPKSQGVFVTDVNGNSCKAVKKVGDQWWMYYRDCCTPPEEFGSAGDSIRTETTMILDKDGVCSENPVRSATEPETYPSELAEPCL